MLRQGGERAMNADTLPRLAWDGIAQKPPPVRAVSADGRAAWRRCSTFSRRARKRTLRRCCRGGDITLPDPAARQLRARDFLGADLPVLHELVPHPPAASANSRLYNVLGMGKRNLARIVMWETLLPAGIALAGRARSRRMLLSKLAELALTHLMGGEISYSYPLSGQVRAPDGAVIFAVDLRADPAREHRPHPRREPRGSCCAARPRGKSRPRANWLLGAAGAGTARRGRTGSPSASASRSRRSCGSSSRS